VAPAGGDGLPWKGEPAPKGAGRVNNSRGSRNTPARMVGGDQEAGRGEKHTCKDGRG
jgi:hypothetical protein